jgi:MoaA/NifB/PqqE/SkfB family radical SAM enzyme
MRRCNLACAYCNEYDAVSAPVPLQAMLRRVDLLAGLGTSAITISGGEPLMHPELDAIVARVRERGWSPRSSPTAITSRRSGSRA